MMAIRFFSLIARVSRGMSRRVRNHFYSKLLSQCGKQLQIDSGVTILCPDHIKLGSNVILNHGVLLQGSEDGCITVGNNVHFSYSSMVLTAGLVFPSQTHEYSNVTIGDNVWVAANVTILPGVKIDDNVFIAAGAVVATNLESGFLYGGVPARKIKQL